LVAKGHLKIRPWSRFFFVVPSMLENGLPNVLVGLTPISQEYQSKIRTNPRLSSSQSNTSNYI
jgi:hypothetical protein